MESAKGDMKKRSMINDINDINYYAAVTVELRYTLIHHSSHLK